MQYVWEGWGRIYNGRCCYLRELGGQQDIEKLDTGIGPYLWIIIWNFDGEIQF